MRNNKSVYSSQAKTRRAADRCRINGPNLKVRHYNHDVR